MKCLNCDYIVVDKFCENCGQKISTKRFSLVSIFDYAVLTGIFSVDKGILFTIKELFTKPGHSIREYIQGKRINYFNAFTLVLLLLTIMYFIEEYSGIKISDLTSTGNKEFAGNLDDFTKEYPRFIYLISIPLLAISSYLFFRKGRCNFAENLVLNTYVIGGQIVMSIPFSILTVFYKNIEALSVIYHFLSFVVAVYAIWVYYQFFSTVGYRKIGLFIRSLFSLALYVILQGIIIAIIMLSKKFI